MNLHTTLVSARKLLVATAVTMVTAACLGSAATSTSASAGHDSATVSATKEWKVVSSSAATTNRTKEW